MKAIRLHEYGGPEVLLWEEAPAPELGADEVLVRVRAVAVNPPDWYLREGFKTLPKEWGVHVELPAIPGTDISGVVEQVGPGVEGFAVGDEVFAMVRFPSFGDSKAYAELVSVPASELAHKPAGVSHEEAAAVSMSGLTAWQYLIEVGHNQPNPLQATPHRPMTLGPGMTVLVNGAAGGVGHLALQLAKWKGARVIAVASGEHEAFLRELGADEFIDYTKERPEERVRDLDLVVDAVGGEHSVRFLPTLKRGGALYPVYLAPHDPAELSRLGVTLSMTQVRSNGRQLETLGQMLQAGSLRVKIDSTFPLAEASRAHERAARGHIEGKIVLTVEAV